MKDDIKETLEDVKRHLDYVEATKQCSIRDNEMKAMYDYITNLQEELDISQTNEGTYRLEMLDITKILGLDEHTTFDEVKEYATNLQEENEGAILIGKELNKENERLRKELELCKKNGEI